MSLKIGELTKLVYLNQSLLYYFIFCQKNKLAKDDKNITYEHHIVSQNLTTKPMPGIPERILLFLHNAECRIPSCHQVNSMSYQISEFDTESKN